MLLPLAVSFDKIGVAAGLPVKLVPSEGTLQTIGWWAASASAVLCIAKAVLLASDSASAWFNPFRAVAMALEIVIPLCLAILLHRSSCLDSERAKKVASLEDHTAKRAKMIADAAGDAESKGSADDDDEEEPTLNCKTFWALAKFFRPYFVPKGTANLIRAFCTYALMAAQQVAGIMAPLYIGQAAQSLSDGTELSTVVKYVALYTGLNFLSQGFKEAQNCVYQYVKAEAYKQINSAVFRHLLSLSIEWHHAKKLGVVQRVIDRGITSADSVVKYLILYLAPYIGQVSNAFFSFFFSLSLLSLFSPPRLSRFISYDYNYYHL